MLLVATRKQHLWRWPAVVHFTCSSAASGLYLLSTLSLGLDSSISWLPQMFVKQLWIAPLLVFFGFFTLSVEAGRPLRGHYLFRHLNRSWMSVEAISGAVFITSGIVGLIFSYWVFQLITCVAALLLVLSQGLMVYKSRAITAWNVGIIPFLFVTSSLSTGSSLLLVLGGIYGLTFSPCILQTVLACITLNLFSWFLFLYYPKEQAFKQATKVIRDKRSHIFTIGFGHVLPVILLFFIYSALTQKGFEPNVFHHFITFIAGLSLLTGSWNQKADILLASGYYREITLE